MTYGEGNSCQTAGGDNKGWRYCYTNPLPSTPQAPAPTIPPFGEASNPYDSHGDLAAYWAVGPSVVLNNVLQSKGFQIRIGGGKNEQYITGQRSTETDLNIVDEVNQNMINLGDGTISNPTSLSTRIHTLLTSNPLNTVGGATYEVKRGDYVFLNPVFFDTGMPNPAISQHGLVVVGWQSALNCRTAIFANGMDKNGGYKRWTVPEFRMTYTEAMTAGIANPVPWVADFTSPPNGNTLEDATQSPVPRPFYCTMFIEDAAQLDRFYAHNWYFYTLPDEVTVSTQNGHLNQLYVDPQWFWSETD